MQTRGLELEDIDTLILTHLHWDHCQNADMFPNAKVYDYRDRHHMTHAACAWYSSGFDDAVAIVVDANGSKINEKIEIESMYDLPSWNVIHKRYFDQSSISDIQYLKKQKCLNAKG